MSRQRTIWDAADAVSRANKALHDLVVELYPEGCAIRWEVGGHEASGHVVMHGYGDGVKVKNEWTGKSRWIASFNFRS